MTIHMPLLSLAGRSAVVTGGCGAIGAAIAASLDAAGATVSSLDLPGTEPPTNVALEPCDLAKPDDIARVARLLGERETAPDIFIHCAGITRDRVLWKLDDADWNDVMRVNLDAAFLLLRALVPGMREAGRGGNVVMIASINGERGKFGQTNYAASKAGLIGLAKSAARELGGFDIRVNVVSPGFIETPMTADLPEAVRNAAVAETALNRPGTPGDVAGAVLFLCSSLSSHITGQVIRVDGGQCTA